MNGVFNEYHSNRKNNLSLPFTSAIYMFKSFSSRYMGYMAYFPAPISKKQRKTTMKKFLIILRKQIFSYISE